MVGYPEPPWRTFGRAFFQPFLVRAEALRGLPEGLEVERVGRWGIGLLGYVEYVAPSPLTYRELVWMPCRVRARLADGSSTRGYFVERMYVDSQPSIAAGRELWALPKARADFEVDDASVRVRTEDGATLTIAIAARGPAWRARSRIATLQPDGRELVRFVGSSDARVSSGRVELGARSGTEGWRGLAGAARMRGLGVAMRSFETTMHEPRRLAWR